MDDMVQAAEQVGAWLKDHCTALCMHVHISPKHCAQHPL